MDPHSRLSQYNNQQGRPKSGPHLQGVRQMEVRTMNVFEQFRSSPSASRDSFSSSSCSTSSRDLKVKDPAARPIASNSRVRRDEKYKRDMYLAFIDNALSQKARGVNEHYDDLVRQFSPSALSAATGGQTQTPQAAHQLQLRAYLTALSHVVSKLDRSHFSLVDAIISLPWTTMDSGFVKVYISFVGMLVSARPEYLVLVLERAAQCLTYHSARNALNAGFVESSSAPLTRRIVYDRVHSLVAQLLEVIPTLPSSLYPLLARNFPHKRQREAEHVTYIRNLLRLSDYCPELWDRILGLIVDKTLQIDVEIQVELEELEGEGAGDEAEEIFHLDPFDTLVGQEGSDSGSESGDDEDEGGLSDVSSEAGSDSDADKEDEQMGVKHIQDMVSKLDSILEVIFSHLDRLHSAMTASPAESRELSPEPKDAIAISDLDKEVPVPTAVSLSTSAQRRRALAESHFHTLLAIFERTILRTFKSRYTQFLLFWYSSLDTQFRDRFLGAVISTALLEPAQPVVTRAAAASYVASYVSRAAFVPREETQMVVRVLCQFLETHLDEFDAYMKQQVMNSRDGFANAQGPQSAEQHAVFYAAAQAMFLIFCFRWRDLMQHDENEVVYDEFGDTAASNSAAHRAWIPELNVMQRVVNSALNPLKICSSNVVQQFARVAQRVGFIYCFPILEANRRSEHSLDSKCGSGSDAATALMTRSFDADLTTFFPFDPFKLPRSSVYIEGIYREWRSVAVEDSDEEEEEEEEEEDVVDEESGYSDDDQNVAAVSGVPVIKQTDDDQYMHGPSSFIDGAGGLGESFGGMSISPSRPPEIVAA